MNTIKAIETRYKGYKFRSRLEARWAVFFDAMGYDWKYERQGYSLQDGELPYLPDFEIDRGGGGTPLYVEVKGSKDAIVKEWERYSSLLDYGGVLPGFANSYDSPISRPTGLLLLGDIPVPNRKIVFHPLIQHHEGLCRRWATFMPHADSPLMSVDDGALSLLVDMEVEFGLESSSKHWTVETRTPIESRYYPSIVEAYAAARSARFEHGESGAA